MKTALQVWTVVARLAVLAACMGLGLDGKASGQVTNVTVTVTERPLAPNIIVPQSRAFHIASAYAAAGPATPVRPAVQITEVQAGVVILEQAATTTMDITVQNPTGTRMEAELLVPVPEGAAVRGFSFEGAAKEATAELLPKEQAKRIYHEIVAKTRDPAMLEFVGYNLIRSSVFPVAANSTQKVRLTYEHLLPADGARIDYVLPRSESVDYKIPWKISVKIQSTAPISTVYSPSHQIDMQRGSANVVSVKLKESSAMEPGPFRLSCLRDQHGVTASLLAYPDAKGEGGYFLLLAGLPAEGEHGDRPGLKREVTVVLDRSGSMTGEKWEQARAAALQIVQGLGEGEFFNVIDYSDSIASFASAPVAKTKNNAEEVSHYLRRLSAGGGTNLHDAVVESLRPRPSEGTLPIVVFLTDGLPTVGVRDEVAIRNDVAKANVYKRRIYTFGVGYDVNAPLLSNLANTSRAVSTFILPKEDVEAKVSQVYRRLSGPVLAEPVLATLDGEGKTSSQRTIDVLPRELPDMFEGDNLVVLGKYKGQTPLCFQLKGNYQGKERAFQFKFDLASATNRNAFVPRLWASRKIAYLIEEIRQAGAASPALANPAAAMPPTDPRTKELVDEIVRLSVEFGILTEYTAFLAREGTDLSGRDDVLRQANANFQSRAVMSRAGVGAVNQSVNYNSQREQGQLNARNRFFDERMNSVEIATVQQVNDRAFFQRGNRWVDSETLIAGRTAEPDETVTFGSPEYLKLVERLSEQNRSGTISLKGEILLKVDGKCILVK